MSYKPPLIEKQRQKTHVSLDVKNLVDDDMKLLVSGPVGHIQVLQLCKSAKIVAWNRIFWRGIKTLSLGGDWSSLKQLLLSSYNQEQNQIGDLGCLWLARVNMPQVEKLSLGSNEIGVAGLSHLVKGNFKALSQILLSRNHFSSGSMRLFASLNCSLTLLQLGRCEMTLHELRVLLLMQHPLRKLWIFTNNVSMEEESKIKVLLNDKYNGALIADN